MKRVHRRIVFVMLAVAGAMMTSNAVARADEFNDERMRAGQAAYEGRRYTEAIDQFRIAAFGSLDRPPALSEALARLALAESAGGKTSRADATLARFMEVERRFGVYPPSGLDPDTRRAFEALLLARIPQANLLAVPTLAGLVVTEEQKIARLPAPERRKALEAAAKREPASTVWPLALSRDALARNDARDAERWAGKALSIAPGNPDALALRARARVLRGDYSDALQDLAVLSAEERLKRPECNADAFVALVETRNFVAAEEVLPRVPTDLLTRPEVARAQQALASSKPRPTPPPMVAKAAPAAPATPTTGSGAPRATPAKPTPARPVPSPVDVAAASRDTLAETRRLVTGGKSAEALPILNRALQKDPGNRELRLALLEAAALSRAYAQGVAQLPMLTPFADSEAASMFYAAVVLYETGKAAEARTYLEQAAPRVSGQLVDEYSRKILGKT